ncbi:hypothetical protein AB3D27_000094 [Vibrio alginolyticus]
MAVINGTNVYSVPVFNAVVVCKALNIHIKKIAKKRLMIRLLGNTSFAILMRCFFVRIKGNNTSAASRNLNNVKENGLITPDSFSEDKKILQPALSLIRTKGDI